MNEIYLVCSDVYIDGKLSDGPRPIIACSREQDAIDICKSEQIRFNLGNDLSFYHRILFYKPIHFCS